VEDPGQDQAKAAENAQIEAQYNLARSLLWTGSVDRAITLVEDICRRRPWETRFLQILARAYHAGGYVRQAERVIQAMYPDGTALPAAVRITLGEIKYRLGDRRAALQLLGEAAAEQHHAPRLQIRLGETYLRLRCWEDAERAFHRALESCDDAARAWQGLSTVYRRWGRNEATVETALKAVHYLYSSPEAHFNLGVALARTGDTERAIVAFETALKFRPTLAGAHRWLALLCAADPQRSDQAAAHRQETARLHMSQQQARRDRRRRCDVLFELPAIPPVDERLATLNQERPLPRDPSEKSGRLFVLVSGLPRSGTSLMMQMLEAGGLPVVTDGKRSADDDNPRGYYEWEDLKQIGKRPELLDDQALDRKGIKAISMLLPRMPAWHDYKVIFMVRPIDQVVASQARMLLHRDAPRAPFSPDAVGQSLAKHRDETLRWLAAAQHMQVLQVDYPTLVQSPDHVVPQIAAFLGPELVPRPQAMLSAIDPTLYRQRSPVAEAER
jgi:Flp pilus assembly protein TadD